MQYAPKQQIDMVHVIMQYVTMHDTYFIGFSWFQSNPLSFYFLECFPAKSKTFRI